MSLKIANSLLFSNAEASLVINQLTKQLKTVKAKFLDIISSLREIQGR